MIVELRTVDLAKIPRVAVTEILPDGMGRDIAWFHEESEAQEYCVWKNSAESKEKGGKS